MKAKTTEASQNHHLRQCLTQEDLKEKITKQTLECSLYFRLFAVWWQGATSTLFPSVKTIDLDTFKKKEHNTNVCLGYAAFFLQILVMFATIATITTITEMDFERTE